MQYIRDIEQRFLAWEIKNIDTHPWFVAQRQYCLDNAPANHLPSFPMLTIVGSVVAFFIFFFVMKFIISPIFPQYRKLKPSDKEKWNVK
jgi:hypothetical protein